MKRGLERFDNPGSHEQARIAKEQVKAALELIKANLGFFLYPLMNPAEFQRWVGQSAHQDAIASFTNGLVDLGLIRFDESANMLKGSYVEALMGQEYSLVSESDFEKKSPQLKLEAPKFYAAKNGYFNALEKLLDKYQYLLPQLFLSEELKLTILEFNAVHSEAVSAISLKNDFIAKINALANPIADSIGYKTAALKKRGGDERAAIVPFVTRKFKNMVSEFSKNDVGYQKENFEKFNAVCESYRTILKLITDVTAKANELRSARDYSLNVDYLDVLTDQLWTSLGRYSHNNFQAHLGEAEEFNDEIGRYSNLFELIKNNDPKILHMNQVLSQVCQIARKASELENRGYFEEAKTARHLLVSLNRSISVFCNSDMSEKNNLKAFKAQCKQNILNLKPILEQHRKLWKVLLGNLLLVVLTLGVFYLPVCTFKKALGGNFFFFNTTRTGEIINNTEAAVSDLVVPQKSG
ncbi:MAG: hypothetical protein K2X50_08965 [Gammaproteobacteria bacterium]|nr:hypothetical protein [Gammaproteobacteria bacterium]